MNGFRSADVSWDEFKEDYETLSLANPKKRKDFEALMKIFLKKFLLALIGKWLRLQMTRT